MNSPAYRATLATVKAEQQNVFALMCISYNPANAAWLAAELDHAGEQLLDAQAAHYGHAFEIPDLYLQARRMIRQVRQVASGRRIGAQLLAEQDADAAAFERKAQLSQTI